MAMCEDDAISSKGEDKYGKNPSKVVGPICTAMRGFWRASGCRNWKIGRARASGVERTLEVRGKKSSKNARNAMGKTLASQDRRKGCLEEGTNIRLMWTRWLMSLQDAVLWMGQRKFEVDYSRTAT